MATRQDPKPLLEDDALYITDNGACYCGKHTGAAARYTGHDISGQKVDRVTEADQSYYEQIADGRRMACETCSPISQRS